MFEESWLTSLVEVRESALVSRRYGLPGFFILLLYWVWCSYRLEMGVSGNLWIVVKHLLYMMWNAALLWSQCRGNVLHLELKQSILHSWGDISVLLFWWQCSWGFSLVPSGKSRFLTCLIGNRELLPTKCRVTGPHLAVSGKSHVFSPVSAGNWGIFSSYDGDGFWNSGLFSNVRTPV